VGQDGYPAADVTTAGTLDLPPGKRWDVLVTAGPHPGTAWLETLPVSSGPQGDSYPLTKLMKVRVAGKAGPALRMPAGALPSASPSLAGYWNGKSWKLGGALSASPVLLVNAGRNCSTSCSST
jgi:hypothetical protein